MDKERTKAELEALLGHKSRQIRLLVERCDILRGALKKVADNNLDLRRHILEAKNED